MKRAFQILELFPTFRKCQSFPFTEDSEYIGKWQECYDYFMLHCAYNPIGGATPYKATHNIVLIYEGKMSEPLIIWED